ncbi:MAG: HypC/HybG/HupF family hydrogenase formation chaperone [Candidatus Heimdallarchaeota archaeon]|nr:HypC/HybG/HupF family hydrogenase formation chaperone [Candidatus Heimdallarchaeota archaeon]
MCVGIPYKVIRIKEDKAIIQLHDNSEIEIDITLVDVKVGEYVMVQSGIATDVLNAEEAAQSLEIFRKLESLSREPLD